MNPILFFLRKKVFPFFFSFFPSVHSGLFSKVGFSPQESLSYRSIYCEISTTHSGQKEEHSLSFPSLQEGCDTLPPNSFFFVTSRAPFISPFRNLSRMVFFPPFFGGFYSVGASLKPVTKANGNSSTYLSLRDWKIVSPPFPVSPEP